MDSSLPSSSSGPSRESIDLVSGIDLAKFDWSAYESTYTGRALITRLTFLASTLLHDARLTSPSGLALARAALLRAIPLIKQRTWDHETYLRAVHGVAVSLDPSRPMLDDTMDVDVPVEQGDESRGVPDGVWVHAVRESERKENARLVVELNSYQSNLIKESIRLTFLAFADLALKTGNLAAALKHYLGAREHCSLAVHHVELEQAILQACLEHNSAYHLSGHIAKLEASLERVYPQGRAGVNANSATMTVDDVRERRERQEQGQSVRRRVVVRLKVARALVQLGVGTAASFANAARELCELGEGGGLGDWEGQVISTPDTAIITALCLLTNSRRAHIRHELLDRPGFRAALDDASKWMLDAVRAFVDAKYGEAITLLRQHEADFAIIPFVSPHVGEIMSLIRTWAYVQYVQPFSTVRVSTMSQAFGVPEDVMIDELAKLIETNKIKARIDLIDRIVTVKDADPRAKAYYSAQRVGTEVDWMARAALFRLKLIEAGVKVEPKGKGQQGQLLFPPGPAGAPLGLPEADDSGDDELVSEAGSDEPISVEAPA
ncbi:hypothetical protein Q5752_000525 [Cryptotrichosporon argae]